jgi:hypothetical protein
MAPAPTTSGPVKTDSANVDWQFANLFEEVTRQLEESGDIDLERVLREHPEHADRLRELLPTLRAIAGWAVAHDAGADPEWPTGLHHGSDGRTLGDFLPDPMRRLARRVRTT